MISALAALPGVHRVDPPPRAAARGADPVPPPQLRGNGAVAPPAAHVLAPLAQADTFLAAQEERERGTGERPGQGRSQYLGENESRQASPGAETADAATNTVAQAVVAYSRTARVLDTLVSGGNLIPASGIIV